MNSLEFLVIDQHVEVIAGCESVNQLVLVLENALMKSAGDPGVEPPRFIRHDVNVISFHTPGRSRFLGCASE